MRVKDAYFGASRVVFARWGLLLWTPQEGDEPGALRIRVGNDSAGGILPVRAGASGGDAPVNTATDAVSGAVCAGKGAVPVAGAVTVNVTVTVQSAAA